MKIGIDARLFVGNEFTGIARSVYEIIKVWARDYSNHEYYLFSRKNIVFLKELPSNWHIVSQRGKIWSLFTIPICVKKYGLDVYWGTNYELPLSVKGVNYYITIYDLALFRFKGIGETRNTIRLRLLTKNACKRAKKIIAISNATKQDVLDIFGIPADKVEVSYCGGMPTDFVHKHINNSVRFNMNEQPYFLFISTIEPRKNILTIIKAFELFKDKYNTNHKLILAGKKGWKSDDIYGMIDNSYYKNDIILPGFISDDEKQYLLEHACAFIYPSLYEGFGIPILEAFEFGVPVVTTNISSLPEVGGNVAFYIDDAKDYQGLSSRMRKVTELSVQEKEELKVKTKMQLLRFSWKKNAQELMEIFEKGQEK